MAVDLNIRIPAVTRDFGKNSEDRNLQSFYRSGTNPAGLTSDIKYKDCEIYCSSAANAQIKNYGLEITPFHTSARCRPE